MDNLSVLIRPLQGYPEYKACEKLQAEVFGYAPLEVVPYQLLQSFALSGGAVLGAFNDDMLVGAVIGYTGLFSDGTPYHRSQRLMVLPQYRGQGIGERLKCAQASLVRSTGLRMMCWTFDPLRAINAHLNLHKLRGITGLYIADAYKATSSPRDAGLAIDRLWVEWNMMADPLREIEDVTESNGVVVLRNEHDEPGEPVLDCRADTVIIQIPSDFTALQNRQADLPQRWRFVTRSVFRHYFGLGYRAVDFSGEGYLLRRIDGTLPSVTPVIVG